jgi:anti-anti-sigma factor
VTDGAVHLAPRGELDIATVPQLDRALRRAQAASDFVVLDLGGLEFVDSSGAHLLLETHRRMRAADARLVIAHVTAEVRWFFELIGIDRVLEIADDDQANLDMALTAAAWPTPSRLRVDDRAPRGHRRGFHGGRPATPPRSAWQAAHPLFAATPRPPGAAHPARKRQINRKRAPMPTKEAVMDWRGQTMVTTDGEKIGKIGEIYVDRDTDQPEWALVNTGMLGTKSSFVPIADAHPDGDQVRVPFAKDVVTGAPKLDADGELSQQDEAALYAHYGMDYTESRSDSGLPAGGAPQQHTDGGEDSGRDVSGPETDDAMTRSEEELRVGTAERESGRVRLRKHVVTEDVTTTVPVTREEVRVEREPITDANRDAATSGAEISEEEHEVVLHEEEVVVDKRAVPKERVRLDKDTVTEDREVSDTVRKEQIETLDADGQSREGGSR